MPRRKRVYLLRHAKSSWEDPELDDHDRPLAPRGRRAAKLIGAHLRRERIEVSLVLCSSARRARETLELADAPGEILVEEQLYGASSAALLERLRRVSDERDAVMLIGHNPAIHELAIELASEPGELTAEKFPTGALAALSFEGSWPALEPGGARLDWLVKPRQLD